MQSLGKENFNINFNYNNNSYSVNLVKGVGSDHQVIINGNCYNLYCEEGDYETVMKVFNSCNLQSISSDEELKGRLSLLPAISFSGLEKAEKVGKTLLDKKVTNVKEPLSFKSKFEKIQTKGEYNPFDRVFVTTNEVNSKETLQSLKYVPIIGNTGIYTSGLFALDLAASERPGSNIELENIIVVDISPIVRDFWVEIEDIILCSNDRSEAFDLIKNLLNKNQGIYGLPPDECKRSIEKLDQNIQGGVSFLSSDAKFEKIKTIFENKRFAFILLDLLDTKKTNNLAQVLKKNSWTIDTLYLSNIYGLISQGLEDVQERKTNLYEEEFRMLLYSESISSGKFTQSQIIPLILKRSLKEDQAFFMDLFKNDEKGKEKFFKKLDKNVVVANESLDKQRSGYKKDCEQFLTSITDILGKSKSNLVHASRKCDKGCCTNPQRLDSVDKKNVKEIFSTKTQCKKKETIDFSKLELAKFAAGLGGDVDSTKLEIAKLATSRVGVEVEGDVPIKETTQDVKELLSTQNKKMETVDLPKLDLAKLAAGLGGNMSQ